MVGPAAKREAVAHLRERFQMSERRRFGYRRLNQMLKREGTVVNLKKIRRLYAEERLQVKVRQGRQSTNIQPVPPNGG